MKTRTVPVKNVQRLIEAADLLTNRAIGMPGIGLVDGETGFGKTTAVSWLVNQVNGVFVRAQALWSPAAMLKAILFEMDLKARGSCADMTNDVVMGLREKQRPLFIDETNNILRRSVMVEALRDIHDLSTQPVILIGYTGLDQELSRHRQLTSRVLQHVRFEAADAADARLLANELCEVEVGDDLLQSILKLCGGNVRELLVSLARVESFGRTRNLKAVDLAAWGRKDGFFTGSPTARLGSKVTPIGAAQ